jgi:hypothetical protein
MEQQRSSVSFVWGRAGAFMPTILAGYLFIGHCGGGDHGLVVSLRAWGLAVTMAWCSAT